MRDLAAELGLKGSSLYAHVDSKEDLLVEVIEAGAAAFQESADRAVRIEGTALDRLRALVAGHVGVVLADLDEARTFLNEARALDDDRRKAVIAVRDRYEATFRTVLEEGVEEGTLRADLDVPITATFILSILNAVDRWYRPDGRLDPDRLVDAIVGFCTDGIGRAP